MAQTGFTPILIYGSGTATNVPSASNLTNSTNGAELAINYADGKLFYKDGSGNVQTIASKAAASGTFSSVTITGGTINGTTVGATTASTGAFTTLSATGVITSTVATGTAPFTVSSTTPVANLSIGGNAATATSATNVASGAANQIVYNTGSGATSFVTAPTVSSTYLQWNGTSFVWAAVSSSGVTSFQTSLSGLTPSAASTGVVTLAGTLGMTSGGTGANLTAATGSFVYSGASAMALLGGNTTTTPQFVTSTGTGSAAQAPTLTGSTGSGNVVLATTPSVTNPTVTNYVETLFTATGSTTVSLANGTIQEITTSGSTTITLPSSVTGKSFTIIVKYNAADSLVWAGGSTLKWSGGTTPTPTSATGKFDIFNFYQDGTNTYAAVFGQNY